MSYTPNNFKSAKAIMTKGKTIEEQLINDILDMKYPSATKKNKVTKPYDIASILKRRIEETEKLVRDLNQSLEEVQRLTFKEGDAVYHQDHGNCLVKKIFIGDGISTGLDFDLTGKIVVELITVSGYEVVAADTVLPISTATKVLFNEGNKT